MHRYTTSVDQLKFEQLPSTGRSSYRSNHSNITSTQTEHFPKIPHQQLLSHINPFNRSKYKQGQQIISTNLMENKQKQKDKRQQSSQQKINRISQKVLKRQSQKQNCHQCCKNGCVQEKMYEGKDKSGYRNLFNLRLQNLEGLRGQYGCERIREDSTTKIYKHNSQHDYQKPQDCPNYNPTLQKKLSNLQTRLTQIQSKLHNLHLHTLQPHFNKKTQPHPYLQHIHQPSNSSLKLLKNIAQIKDIYTLIRDHKIIQSQINQKISKEINCIFDSIPKIKDDVQRSVKLMMDKWMEEDVRVRGCGLSGDGEKEKNKKQQNEEKEQVKIYNENLKIGSSAKKVHSDLQQRIHCQLDSMSEKIANLDKKLLNQTPMKIIPTHSKPPSVKSIKITPPTPSPPPTTTTTLKITQELHPYFSTRQPLQPPKTLHLQLPQQKNENQPSCSLILSPLSSPSSSNPSPSPSPTPISTYKHTYYIDNNGYLLDESMFYILDQNDKPIKVLDQQFDMLKNLCNGKSEKNIDRGYDKQNMGGNLHSNQNGNEIKGQKCGVLRFR